MLDCWKNYNKIGLKGLQLDDHFGTPVSLGKTKVSMNKAIHFLSAKLRSDKIISRDNKIYLTLSPSTL